MVRTTRMQHQCEPHTRSLLPVGSTTLKSRLSAKVETGKQIDTALLKLYYMCSVDVQELFPGHCYTYFHCAQTKQKNSSSNQIDWSNDDFRVSVSCSGPWIPVLHWLFSKNMNRGANLMRNQLVLPKWTLLDINKSANHD